MAKQSMRERAARAAADFGDSTDAVDQAAARVLGIHRTELRILGVIRFGGAQSAGAVAVSVGLSPAATTEAVQRLVARGMLTRETDPQDRRRAVIDLDAATADRLESLYGPVRDDGLALLRRYDDAALAVIVDFLDRGRALQLTAAERIRSRSGRGPGGSHDQPTG